MPPTSMPLRFVKLAGFLGNCLRSELFLELARSEVPQHLGTFGAGEESPEENASPVDSWVYNSNNYGLLMFKDDIPI